MHGEQCYESVLDQEVKRVLMLFSYLSRTVFLLPQFYLSVGGVRRWLYKHLSGSIKCSWLIENSLHFNLYFS